MSAVTTGHSRSADFKQALKDLEFISVAFSWLFNLMSRVAEPFMLLSAMYIIIEAGIPAASIPVLHNLCIAIMISAPEVILPGAFVIAQQAKEKGHKNTPLLIVCYLFVLLTLITLLSLFVWHFSGTMLSCLMFARCAVGIGYSILIRILSHREKANTPTQSTPPPTFEITPQLISLIAAQVTGSVTSDVTGSVTHLLEEHLQNVTHQASNGIASTLPVAQVSEPRAPARAKRRVAARSSRPVLQLAEGPAETRLANAYAKLREEDVKITVNALRIRARVKNEKARAWLKEHGTEEEGVA